MVRWLKKSFRFFFSKRFLKWCFFFALLLTLSVYLSNQWIISSTKDRIYTTIEAVPTNDVALVLGASKYLSGGRINPYFKYRMEAAARLYHAGKVKHLLVSGDNHVKSYDEASDMRSYLMQLGVPASKITLDYAGFRTLDSVVRSKKVFGQTRLTIVSQEFHNQRALFICDHYNIDAVAYNAKDLSAEKGKKTRWREYLAKFKAVLDLYLLNKSPKFLGDPVTIRV